MGQDLDEVFLGEVVHLHPDGEAALELRDQVAGFTDVKGAGCDEQDVVGVHHAVLGHHAGAFHDG